MYTATVKGGFFAQYGSALAGAGVTSTARRKVARVLGRRGNLVLREIMHELNGVAPGATALAQLARIAHSEDLSGVRAVETVNLVNRATTAADVTEIDADILTHSTKTYDPTPPPNLDGNPLGTR